MLTLINIGIGYLTYEILVGFQVVKNEVFKKGKKWGYVPPSLLFAKDHQNYIEWKEWKGK